LEALFEGEHLFGEFGADRGGDSFGGQSNALGFGRGEGFMGESVGSLDGAVSEVVSQALAARTADGGRSLVVAQQGEGALVGQVEAALQGRKEGQERLSEASDGAGLVGDEIPAAGEKELKLGELSFAGCELTELRSHTSLIGDDASVFGVGFGLSAVGVASPIHAETRDVEDPLVSLPKQREQQRCASSGLIHCPDDLLGEGLSLLDELEEVSLIVFDPAGEQLLSGGVEQVSPVELFAGVDAQPRFVDECLRPSLGYYYLPSEDLAGGSLCSESISPISMSGRGLLVRDRGAIPFKPSDGGEKLAILGPLGRHSGTVPERQTQR